MLSIKKARKHKDEKISEAKNLKLNSYDIGDYRITIFHKLIKGRCQQIRHRSIYLPNTYTLTLLRRDFHPDVSVKTCNTR